MLSKKDLPKLAASVLLMMIVWTSSTEGHAIVTVKKCALTGPLCHTAEECGALPDGHYQWCGSCDMVLSCLDGTARLSEPQNPTFTLWDDHKKSFEMKSSTCSECYFECPPGSAVSPVQGPDCERTGPTCVPDSTFCFTFFTARKFQLCSSCTTFADCTGSPFTSGIGTCPEGTAFDDTLKTCAAQSTTCSECYRPCGGNETEHKDEQHEMNTEEMETTRGDTTAHVDLTTYHEGTTSMLAADTTAVTTEQYSTTRGPTSEAVLPTAGSTTHRPDDGHVGCNSGSLLINLEAQDAKLEIDLRYNRP